MILFQRGDFTLHSGAKSLWKIECDSLTEEDWHTLAIMVRQIVGPFGHCIGVPRGGLKLQNYLSPMATEGPCLIVDDVLTSGGSMTRERDRWLSGGPTIPKYHEVIGAVIFARGLCPGWIEPVFQMPECLWVGK